ncbi:3-ketoacyl-ACP reductase [Mesorhizobium sp. M2D.F.Ca.ET.185.01.1.1]|uniref:3-ketoacyl-ACP reductase n=2 Tax=Mesorhizobium TaxID=68287 RepID=UPI000FCCA9D4|nr:MULTISPECIES: 3-ketoacyl-ACP reductase [unclassified Mesorhizobium]TGP82696.1 3-ketoacyl-ACP reductase [bacterium M00.F.Ca.ET.227.01.1.1]TGP94450.1 3-ketoacyl-ACP reductase [bacterium M00.F.Ca.ET.221.01.1.1]TGP97903.1 3-ketoacyl-ACP reductase [bacterium M00.F.Ca.ET.222.01.1.1]TGU11785.1 3-ketoacyl-ACP reductase [bacterium M00.F.Ca.ET.163.01.1.1]TGU35962.1 3-ketoacyl-ACP reductase [bacterium M00.F.Ca.ET.156.01.1.1]TGU48885.1 3-ketoacyl-ACP reductase [bacterium M00.F.Ca.ET.146.01.1.1]TGV706
MTRPAAIVTGGARGIGLACAEALADAGFDILVADLAGKPADGLAEKITGRGAKFAYAACDIADLTCHSKLVETTMRAFGRIDCLVNNAGIGAVVRGDLLELKPENFDRALDTNLRGTVFLSQAVAKAMLATPAGSARSIITITSVSAAMASPERADYCISKAGLSMWVKNLALRLAAENIGVFEVRPGIIRTDMTASVSAKYNALIDGGLVPAKRWGEAGDISAVVAVLASGKFGFSTGSVIDVDGALSVPRL